MPFKCSPTVIIFSYEIQGRCMERSSSKDINEGGVLPNMFYFFIAKLTLSQGGLGPGNVYGEFIQSHGF